MTAAATSTWKRLALRPLGVLVLAVLVLNAAGWTVDGSALRQEDDSWGFVFAAYFLSVYAVPVVLVAAVCAGLAHVVDEPREQAACAWIGAGAAALAGVFLAVLVLPTLGDSPAGSVFGVVALGVAAALLWPLATCVRRRRR
jgi:hypothetical protein